MNKFSSLTIVFFFVLFGITSTNNLALADTNTVSTMIPIESYVDPNLNLIAIDLLCNDVSVPETIFTIVPSNDSNVTVESLTANLVTVVRAGEFRIEFEWNMDVASTATSGGVRITVPKDQLPTNLVVVYFHLLKYRV